MPVELNLQYIQAELARIDALIRRQVRRWQAAGQDVGDTFRGLYVSDGDAEALMARSLGGSWADFTPPQADEQFGLEWQAALAAGQALRAQAEATSETLRLPRLVEEFSLDGLERDALLICLAPALDLRYERVYGYLQDDVTRKRPTVNLILDLLDLTGLERVQWLARFEPGGSLLRQHLLERPSEGQGLTLLGQTLEVDASVAAWLLGRYQPRPELADCAHLQPPDSQPATELVEAQTRQELQRICTVAAQEGFAPTIVLFGADHDAQQIAGHWLSSELNRPLLQVDISGHEPGERLTRLVTLALRDARLNGAIPWFSGWEACLVDGVAPAGVMQALRDFPEIVLISSHHVWQIGGAALSRPCAWIECAGPDYSQRRLLWRYYLPELPENELAELAGQFQLSTGQIRAAFALARDRALQTGSLINQASLLAAARQVSNPRLTALARKITPRYTWQDIVLPDDQRQILHEIVSTVRQRGRVLDDWGLGSKLVASRGVTVLFAGPPGTGKTMSAEVISSELGLDLYKIDLSTIVSKYIGETEKNLERIFQEAESSNAILFFDEADALFGKRSEVKDSHDRYANIEISYLLQRMEAYDGVTMLATNLRANLDQAFTRRLQFAVDFPFPEESDRLRIWQTLFPPAVPCAADVDLPWLARRFKLAGGNIRNVLVSAAYLAAANGGEVSMAHLLHATRREMQKMGRLVSPGDLSLHPSLAGVPDEYGQIEGME
jgi:ATP-dependent 26S proteasome regulatory subunit